MGDGAKLFNQRLTACCGREKLWLFPKDSRTWQQECFHTVAVLHKRNKVGLDRQRQKAGKHSKETQVYRVWLRGQHDSLQDRAGRQNDGRASARTKIYD